MKKSIKTTLALVVSFILLFGVLDVPIYAIDTSAPIENEAVLDLSEYTFENIPEQLLADLTIDNTKSISNSQNTSHPVSLYGLNNNSTETNTTTEAELSVVGLTTDSAEDLTSLTVVNSDGSKTIHRYFEDIKFIDESGKMRFKDNGIYVSNTTRFLFEDYAFENGTNDVKTFYPEKISDSIKLETKDLEISIKPIIPSGIEIEEKKAAITKLSTQNECVQYDDVFGQGISLQYIPTGQGFKENIVFDSHPQKYEFLFEINTNGLVPSAMSGTSIELLNPETNEAVAMLHPVDMKDSSVDENGVSNPKITLNNSMELESTNTSGLYVLKVVLNKDFLDSPDTVYPVIVDPSVTTSVSNAQYTTVYQNGASDTTVTNTGKTLNGMNSYAYIKTDSMQQYAYINTSNITSAFYRAYEYSNVPSTGNIEVYDSFFTTPASNVTYDYCQETIDTSNYIHTYSIPGTNMWYSIPITELVIQWIDSATTPSYIYGQEAFGFILRYTNTTTNSSRKLYPPSNTSYPPLITINYEEDTSLPSGLYYIKNLMSGRYLDVSNAKNNINNTNLNVITFPFQSSLNELWMVEHVGSGWYRLYSMYHFATRQYLCNADEAAKTTNTTSDSILFRIVQNVEYYTYRIFSKTALNGLGALDMTNYESSANHWRRVSFFEFHGGNNQRWEFEPIEYSATVNNYFDDGLLKRWSMSNSQAVSGVTHWQNLAKNFYSEVFNLNLTFNTPTQISSLPDKCATVTTTSINNECTSHTPKHKDRSNIISDLETAYPKAYKTISVLWTGHKTFEYNDSGQKIEEFYNAGVHRTPPSSSLTNAVCWPGSHAAMLNIGVYPNNGTVLKTPTEFTASTMKAKRTYLHELAHAFGAKDSYCFDNATGTSTRCTNTNCVDCYSTTTPYGTNCIMANLYPNSMSNDMNTWLCAQCKADISNHIIKYYHQIP